MSNTITLNASLTIRECAALKEQLEQCLTHNDANEAIVLQAGDVEQLSTSALQLVLSFAKSAQKQARRVQLLNCSAAFETALNTLGLTDAFAPYRNG